MIRGLMRPSSSAAGEGAVHPVLPAVGPSTELQTWCSVGAQIVPEVKWWGMGWMGATGGWDGAHRMRAGRAPGQATLMYKDQGQPGM
jgi:hypothetical protein